MRPGDKKKLQEEEEGEKEVPSVYAW